MAQGGALRKVDYLPGPSRFPALLPPASEGSLPSLDIGNGSHGPTTVSPERKAGTGGSNAAAASWPAGPMSDSLCVAFLLVIFLCFVLFQGLAGATLGKCVLGLRSRERARFDDRVAGTRVVRIR